MATLDLFAPEPSNDPTSYAAGSPVRTYRAQESAAVSVATARAYGPNSRELWAIYDRASRSWKTSALSLFADSRPFAETLPRSGMTRNGTLYRLPPLVRIIKGTGFTSLLPTPRAAEWKGTGPIGSKSHLHRVLRRYLDATMQAKTGKSGQLNPQFVEWMMGFPDGWTDIGCDVWETLLSRKSLKLSGA